MSKAGRLAKAQERAALEAETHLQERRALAPRPLAVRIAAAFGYHPQVWRLQGFSRIAFDAASGVQRHLYPSTRSA